MNEGNLVNFHTYIYHVLPLPNLLQNRSILKKEINEMNFTDISAFTKSILNSSADNSTLKKTLTYFVRSLGSWKFNYRNTPLKYRQRFKIFNYLSDDIFPPPFPLFINSSKNYLIASIKEKFKLINPEVRIELFPQGFILIEFGFINMKMFTQKELGEIQQEIMRFIKKIKISILNSIFIAEKIPEVFTQINPQEGSIVQIIQNDSETASSTILERYKKVGNFSLGRIQLFSLNENRYFLIQWKKSRYVRKDILMAFKWFFLLNNSLDSFSKNILDFLNDDKIDICTLENIWKIILLGINPEIHYSNYEGNSPIFPKKYQKRIFQKLSRSSNLEQRYKNFIKTIKMNSYHFSIFAHQALVNLDKKNRIDRRAKLIVGIRSNLKRIPLDENIELDDYEIKIINILIKKYQSDYLKVVKGVIVSENMGCIVQRELGHKLGMKDYEIYGSKREELKKVIISLFKKDLIQTKVFGNRNDKYICLNILSKFVKLKIARGIYR